VRTTIISTGEELICGRTVDTNAGFLAAELARCGFQVQRLLAVGDEPELLREEIRRCAGDSDLIVVTGGLGPTADDRTRRAIAEAAGRELAEDEESRLHVVDRLRSFGREASEGHLAQAHFPSGSTVFPNPRGTARGFACRADSAWVVAMPGVPGEMRGMFAESVLPFLLRRLSPHGHVRIETVNLFPASESEVDERIADLTAHGRNPSIGITVRNGVVSVTLRARADDEQEAEQMVRRDRQTLEARFGERIFEGPTLAEALSKRLISRGLTIAAAESITGGLIGNMLVDVPGISRCFLGGVVAYSNEVKVARLGVPRAEIERHGAVSREVAASMARAVQQALGSDLAVSTTGIAGPTGGTEQKPVGLVYVGVCFEEEMRVARLDLRGDRRQIKDRAAKHALNFARLALLKGMQSLGPDLTI
jgi:nicotinamide-nucleotide amidase